MKNQRGSLLIIVLLILLILAMAGGAAFYYFYVLSGKTNSTNFQTTANKGSTNPSDLDSEMKSITTDDNSVSLDPAKDTAGL